MLSIVLTQPLEAVIRKMHGLIISNIKCELLTRRPEVSLLVEVDPSVRHPNRPDSDVKLPRSIQHWFLKVLLYDPLASHRLRVDEADDVLHVLEDLDSSTLVQVLRLYKPKIVEGVLEGHSFLGIESFGKISHSFSEVLPVLIIHGSIDDV